jgi:hypothetical protein
MKFETLAPEHKQVLLNIQKSIPSEWLSKVTKREHLAPTVREVMEKALVDPDVSEETKAECRMVLDSALMKLEIDNEQLDMTELIDSYVELEVIKAVMCKRLPPTKKRKSYEVALKRFNKLKEKYDKRK